VAGILRCVLGFVEDRFAAVGSVFADGLASGAEVGADRATGQRGDQSRFDVTATRTRAWRGAEIPAANGISNARAIATILAVLACGGAAAGRRLLSEAGCRRALEVQVEGRDLILDLPLRFGFAVAGGMMPNPNTLYWAASADPSSSSTTTPAPRSPTPRTGWATRSPTYAAWAWPWPCGKHSLCAEACAGGW
jgi:hypothetical protein